jgi:hypothetical protein
MNNRIQDAHRHRNTDGDSYTHAHAHEADHCAADCDNHGAPPVARVVKDERQSAAVGR